MLLFQFFNLEKLPDYRCKRIGLSKISLIQCLAMSLQSETQYGIV